MELEPLRLLSPVFRVRLTWAQHFKRLSGARHALHFRITGRANGQAQVNGAGPPSLPTPHSDEGIDGVEKFNPLSTLMFVIAKHPHLPTRGGTASSCFPSAPSPGTLPIAGAKTQRESPDVLHAAPVRLVPGAVRCGG